MDNSLNNKALATYAAKLESQIDLLETELTYLNNLLIDLGFAEEIRTLKISAEELLTESRGYRCDNQLKS